MGKKTDRKVEVVGLIVGKKLTLRELEDLGRWWGMGPAEVRRILRYMPREDLARVLLAEVPEEERPQGRIGKSARLNTVLEKELNRWKCETIAAFRGYAWLQLSRSERKPGSVEDVIVLVDGPEKEGVLLGGTLQAEFTIRSWMEWGGRQGRIPYFFGDNVRDCPEVELKNTPIAIMAARGVDARVTEIEWSVHDMLLQTKDTGMWKPLKFAEGYFLVDEAVPPEVKRRLRKYNMAQETSILDANTG